MTDIQIHGTEQVQAGSIVDASISSSAAIALSKLADYVKLLLSDGTVSMAANLNLGGFLINSLADAVASTDAVNLSQVNALIAAAVTAGLVPFTFEGAYSSGTTYAVNELVSFNNVLYICIAATTGNDPDVSPTYWTVVVAGTGPQTATTASLTTATGSNTIAVVAGEAFSPGQVVVVASGSNYAHFQVTAVASTTIVGTFAPQTGDAAAGTVLTAGATVGLSAPQGSTGGPIWLGAYSGSTAYTLGQAVLFGGSSWICVVPTTGNAPPALPTTSNTWWQVIAEIGATGPTGPPGSYTATAPIQISGTVISAEAATTSSAGVVQLETSSTDTSGGHVVTANDTRLLTADGTTITNAGGVISAVGGGGGGGGGSLPTDYISGCLLAYDSTTSIYVGTGSAYVPSASGVVTIASQQTLTPTLAASTLYYVYMSGATSFTVSATAPSSNYQGTAWDDGSGNRYIGSFLTNASSHIINFLCLSGNCVMYRTNTFSSPFLVLNTASATHGSAFSVSCSSVVPKTSRSIKASILVTYGGSWAISFGESDGAVPSGSNGTQVLQGSSTEQMVQIDLLLDSSQAFECYCNAAYSVAVGVLGYVDAR
jgi:hypothetical protein